MTVLVTVAIQDVPPNLQSGAFYNALKDNEDENDGVIFIPSDCLTDCSAIYNEFELRRMMLSLRYWIVEDVPETLIALSSVQGADSFLRPVSNEFKRDFPYLEDLLAISCSTNIVDKLIVAAGKGRLDALQFLLRDQIASAVPKRVCESAAKHGQYECLKYLFELDCLWDSYLCQVAAQNGHLDCLIFAHEHGVPWELDTSLGAARNGHLQCLQYAHAHGCPWDKTICVAAALNNHLDCLVYAHENGCAWDKYTCQVAASRGHLACLQYAHEQGCLWDEQTSKAAAEHGHLRCLVYAHSHGCPLPVLRFPNELGHGAELLTAAQKACLEYVNAHGV